MFRGLHMKQASGLRQTLFITLGLIALIFILLFYVLYIFLV